MLCDTHWPRRVCSFALCVCVSWLPQTAPTVHEVTPFTVSLQWSIPDCGDGPPFGEDTKFELEIKEGGGKTTVVSVGAATTWRAKPLLPGTTYNFRIRVFRDTIPSKYVLLLRTSLLVISVLLHCVCVLRGTLRVAQSSIYPIHIF